MSATIIEQRHSRRMNDARVQTHPCYSKDAHKYARIHLPVAPACNIQCNYCNRKFDCSNESRPGVVSNLLSPAEAVHRFTSVKKRMPELKVVGIAGPGDPLANPQATLATLSAIKELDEDVHLCVSTNGLNLAEHIESLAALNVHHLTITMNTLNPNIAAMLYSWVYFNNQRYHGIEAAEVLLTQQLKGLKLAAEADILVKVNTVLVPGINDIELDKLAKEIQHHGAFLHNVMPLISDPSHGTFFGLNEIAGPTEEQLSQARVVAGNDMPQMSHCQQCRADAVGKLNDDQSCSSLKDMERKPSDALARVAVASKQGDVIDTHLGHATHFYIYDIFENNEVLVEKRAVDQYCKGPSDCHDEESENAFNTILKALADCQQVHCSRIGISPWQELVNNNITPAIDYAMFPIEDALHIIRTQLAEKLTSCHSQEAC